MQRIQKYVDNSELCKKAGDKKTDIHSQNGNES